MQRRWRPRPGPPRRDGLDGAALAAHLGVPRLVGDLLAARGTTRVEDAGRFLRPKLTDLSDPADLPGVNRAAARIGDAIARHQPIVIYGDYDVDGITASAILWHVLRHCGADVSTYVPHRLDEGYGLNEDAIRTLSQARSAKRGAAAAGERPLIVSVDCGITATGPARVARELGLDLIITDHHQFDPADLPEAYALVHPGLAPGAGVVDAAMDAPAPADAPAGSLCDLCGAGVAFKLAWQVARLHCGANRVSRDLQELLLDLLSLVALGTVADVVPLVGENRVLTAVGLRRIKDTRFVGLNALIDAARLRDEKVDAYHVGFVLGPRLNACGRMGHASRAVHLLTAADADQARETAEFLTRENDRRRATERQIFDQAQRMVLDAGYDHPATRAIVLAHEGWHAGVIGIVASRLVERFCRPVVLLCASEADGAAHGSARSVDGVSIHQGLCACAEHLDRFGGHAMAAGLALRLDALSAFRESLVSYINDRLAPDDLVRTIEYDASVALSDCTVELFRHIRLLEPFGRGNPAPRLLLEQVVLDRPAQRIGGGGRHLSLLLRQGDRIMRAVAFGHGDWAQHLPAGVRIDAIFEPRLSVWQGVTRADLHIQDLRLSTDRADRS